MPDNLGYARRAVPMSIVPSSVLRVDRPRDPEALATILAVILDSTPFIIAGGRAHVVQLRQTVLLWDPLGRAAVT